MTLMIAVVVLVASAMIAAGAIVLLFPLLRRYALARPNARSSHRIPTPQGGGIAVMAAIICVLAATSLVLPQILADPVRLAIKFAAAAALALVGAVDDIRPIEPGPRLFLQAATVAIVVAALPPSLRVIPILPWWTERALMGLGALWMVNLVNFMDGIDLLTVAEVVPIATALVVFGFIGALPADATLAALALAGAMLGFAPFNVPVARLFLGDVGSLPIGLITAWLLISLAENHFAAALLLPLYYLADPTITLLRRLIGGERVTQAHRTHFYQQAVDNGRSVPQVIASIFSLNILLALLAAVTIIHPVLRVQITCCVIGCAGVATELAWLARNRKHA